MKMMGNLQGLIQSNEGKHKRWVPGQRQVNVVSSYLEVAILHTTSEAASCRVNLRAQGQV